MKHCSYCGEKLDDDSKFCPKCGKKVEEFNSSNVNSSSDGSTINSSNTKVWTGIKLTSFIFMLISILISVFTIFTIYFSSNGSGFRIRIPIALIWQIPMTIYYYKAVINKKKTSTGFKVCTLIFLNLISGILMLCDKDDK